MYFILGKTGYIAQAFIEACKSRKLDYFALSRETIDYTDTELFQDYLLAYSNLAKLKPTIINCAGYVGKPNVDACEANKEDTIKGNITFPAAVASTCRVLGCDYVHISSGCIYNGYEKDFRESDVPNFKFDTGSFYSGSKALSEEVVIASCARSYVFRLRVPFDEKPSPRNYITKMLSYDRLLDVRNSFSHRADFVNACMDILEKKAPYGTYNLTNPGSLFTREVIDMIKEYIKPDKDFSFYSDEDTFLQDVKAPRSSCVLDVSKALKYTKLRNVRCAFKDALTKYGVSHEGTQ